MDGEHVYRQLIDIVPDVIYGIDADTRAIKSLNPAFETITGWRADEWLGNPFSEILHPDDIQRAVAMFDVVLSGRTTPPQLLRVRAKSGAYLTGEFRSAPHIEDGRVVGVFGIARDVTERVRIDEQQRYLAEISAQLSSSLDYHTTLNEIARSAVPILADWCMVYRREPDGSIQRVAFTHADPSKAGIAEAIVSETTIDPDAVHGVSAVIRSGRSLLYPDVPPEVLFGDVHEPERLSELVRGIEVTSWMCVPLIARGQILGAIAFNTTESQRRFDERDLAFAEDIAARAALAIDNAELYSASQRAVREREAFITTASHELKTPLTTIKGMVQLLERVFERGQVNQQRMALLMSNLATQVSRFETVIEDLLDVTRIRQGRMELRIDHVDLVALAQQVIDRVRDADLIDEQRNVRLDAPDSVVGIWDPNRLDQVLTNLISNALKFSPGGEPVHVRIRRVGDTAELTVRDEGIGIPKEEQSQLFQPFGRSETVRRTVSGIGLGLFITRQIVEQHGGTISVESEPGEGTTFTVRLSLEPLSQTSRNESPSSEPRNDIPRNEELT